TGGRRWDGGGEHDGDEREDRARSLPDAGDGRAPAAPASPSPAAPSGPASSQGGGGDDDSVGVATSHGAPESSGSDASATDTRDGAAAVSLTAHASDGPVEGEESTAEEAEAAAVSATDESDGGRARGSGKGQG
ncbi:unnamed protein product, partial [Scytosiphon promiscuus]